MGTGRWALEQTGESPTLSLPSSGMLAKWRDLSHTGLLHAGHRRCTAQLQGAPFVWKCACPPHGCAVHNTSAVSSAPDSESVSLSEKQLMISQHRVLGGRKPVTLLV